MIQTEEQRRWWFANHPEFSSSHRRMKDGKTNGSKKEANQDKLDPREVDNYVDNALKYETDSVITALLKSVKRNFGTEAELSEEQQKLKAWEKILDDGWETPAEYGGAGLYISEYPRMPTPEELSRWPRELVNQFFRWLDTMLQNNPLIIDPNALEMHHGLPKEFIEKFLACSLEIDEFIMIMRASDHRLKAEGEGRGGVHTGKGRGGDWNSNWRQWFEDNPPENTQKYRDKVREHYNQMVREFNLGDKFILSPKPSGRK